MTGSRRSSSSLGVTPDWSYSEENPNPKLEIRRGAGEAPAGSLRVSHNGKTEIPSTKSEDVQSASGAWRRAGSVHASSASFDSTVPPIGACRGAKPCGCRTKSQIRNPKRVQGFLPAEGSGVSPASLSTPMIGGQGVETGSRDILFTLPCVSAVCYICAEYPEKEF